MPTANSKARILVVDDEAAQMKALCDTLPGEDYQPVGFTDAQSALAELRRAKCDLLLADLMMPGMNGIELLRAAQEIDPDLVAIIMTGDGTIATAVEAMKAGALDYILKPFKLSIVIPVLERALAVRHLRLENAGWRCGSASGPSSSRRRTGNSRHSPIPSRTICAVHSRSSSATPRR